MAYFNTAKIMLKSMFSKPSTGMYPAKKREAFAATRGSIENRISDCIFCGICQKKCPTGAIAVTRDEKSWEIDRLKCLACGACIAPCPKKCLDMKNSYSPSVLKKSTDRFVQPSPEAAAEENKTNA